VWPQLSLDNLLHRTELPGSLLLACQALTEEHVPWGLDEHFFLRGDCPQLPQLAPCQLSSC
jgi:hypothetical protein